MSVRHQLENGWTVIERTSTTRSVCLSRGKSVDAFLRCTSAVVHIPSERVVLCEHFAGATPEECAADLRVAVVNARPGRSTHRDLWTRMRRSDGRTYRFSIVLGSPIDEADAFESIARRLEGDLFSIITTGMEANA